MTTTDGQGRYELKDLPAGRYTLTASKMPYVTLQFGQQRAFEPGKPIQIAAGEVLERIDFSLPRGAVLAGHVLDEFGEPVAGAIIRPLRYRYIAGQRRLMFGGGPPGQPVQSNDLGEYRVFGLTPGQYYLSAIIRNFVGGETEDRSAYAPTYYPSTNNAAEAQRFTLAVGQQIGDVNIVLLPVRTAQVTGTAVDADGRPLSGQSVFLFQRFVGVVGGSGEIKPDGSFLIANVPPGEYTAVTETNNGAHDPRESAMTTLTVTGQDVNGIHLIGQDPAVVLGRMTADGDGASAPTGGARVVIERARFDEDWFGPDTARVREDGSFQVSASAGRAMIRVEGLPPHWALKSVRLNGSDITDTELDLRTSTEVPNVQVIVTNRVSEVSGQVADDQGRPTSDYSVLVFPIDVDQRKYGSRYIDVARPDQAGHFSVEGLPPGEYVAIAVSYFEQGAQYDGQFLESLQSRGLRFHLDDAEHHVIKLKRTSIE